MAHKSRQRWLQLGVMGVPNGRGRAERFLIGERCFCKSLFQSPFSNLNQWVLLPNLNQLARPYHSARPLLQTAFCNAIATCNVTTRCRKQQHGTDNYYYYILKEKGLVPARIHFNIIIKPSIQIQPC